MSWKNKLVKHICSVGERVELSLPLKENEWSRVVSSPIMKILKTTLKNVSKFGLFMM